MHPFGRAGKTRYWNHLSIPKATPCFFRRWMPSVSFEQAEEVTSPFYLHKSSKLCRVTAEAPLLRIVHPLWVGGAEEGALLCWGEVFHLFGALYNKAPYVTILVIIIENKYLLNIKSSRFQNIDVIIQSQRGVSQEAEARTCITNNEREVEGSTPSTPAK